MGIKELPPYLRRPTLFKAEFIGFAYARAATDQPCYNLIEARSLGDVGNEFLGVCKPWISEGVRPVRKSHAPQPSSFPAIPATLRARIAIDTPTVLVHDFAAPIPEGSGPLC